MIQKKINYKNILIDETQIRKEFPEDSDMIKSIVKNGLLDPLKVYPEGKNYRLIDGERRFRALVKLIENQDTKFSKSILCMVYPTPKNKTITQLITDIHKKKISPLEEAEAYKKLIEEDKLSTYEISTSLGLKESYILNRLKLLLLDESAKEKISSGKLNASVIQSLSIDSIKNKPHIIDRIVREDADTNRAKEIIMEEDSNLQRMINHVLRRTFVLFEEAERLDTAMKNLKKRVEYFPHRLLSMLDSCRDNIMVLKSSTEEDLSFSKIKSK